MNKTKYFLAQFLIEVDVTERPDFDDIEASSYFSSALHLSSKEKNLSVKVYPLAAKPESRSDVVVETYEYRGHKIEIYQDADTVGTDRPTYFATAANLQVKNPSSALIGDDIENIEEIKALAHGRVDKRIARMEKNKPR